jgi:predicted nucleic acid-binding protein
MTLIDTSVWIDFFRGRAELEHVEKLKRCLSSNQEVVICGVILMEILQGIRDEKQYQTTRNYLNYLPCVEMKQSTYIKAASCYRALRQQGITIRKPIDCMIAAVALENDCELLHNDRDFDMIAKGFSLRFR